MKTTHIFLHNFRCSGNTVNLALRNYFMDDHIKSGEVHEHFYSRDDIIEQCKHRQPRFILGHNVFGLHHQLDFPCRYFLNLRSPIDRLISGFATWSTEQSRNIIEYYRNHEERSNGMTYRLLGFGKLNGEYYDFIHNKGLTQLPPIDEALFSEAKNNISRYVDAVIIQELHCESMIHFEDRLNLPDLICPQAIMFNQNKSFIVPDHFPADVINTLRAWDTWDEKLYDFGKNTLLSELAGKSHQFFEKVRHRKILSSMMSIKGKNLLDDALIVKCLNQGINTLLHYGLRNDIPLVIRLFVQSISVDKQVATRLIKQIKHLLTNTEYNELLNAI